MRLPGRESAPSREKRPTKPRVRAIGEPTRDYTKIPNQLWDLVESEKLYPGLQYHLCMIIMRMTWGAKERPEYAAIPLTVFSEKSAGADKSGISRELIDLEERGLIRTKSVNGCQTALKLYSMTPVKCWKDARPYVSRVPAAKSAEEPAGDKLIVRPGGKPAAVEAQLCPSGREPIDFRLEYVNAGSITMGISNSIEANVVRITFGDHKAKTDREAVDCSPQEQKTNTGAINRLNAFNTVISVLQTSLFDRPFDSNLPADKKFLKNILKAAGNDLPASEFETFCREEIHSMVRRHRTIYPGILISLAAQAAKKFAGNFAPDSPSASPLPPPSAEEIEALSYCVKCNDTGNDGTWDHGRFTPFTKPFRTCPACNGKRGQP